MSDPCVICHTNSSTEPVGDFVQVVCARCGEFKMTASAFAEAINVWECASARQRANASGWLRSQPPLTLGSDDLPALLSARAPNVCDRAEMVLRQMRQDCDAIGAAIGIFNDQETTDRYVGLSWSLHDHELAYLVDLLRNEQGFLESPKHGSYVITPRGHAHLDERSSTNQDSDIGFCAMWFDESVQSVWTAGIELAITAAGFKAVRMDQVEHNNRIDDEIIASIRKSRFVVADLTDQRGGVYFEAGFAAGLGLPVVWTVRRDELDEQKIHFDTRQYAFVTWTNDTLADFRKKLQDRIEATIGLGPHRRS